MNSSVATWNSRSAPSACEDEVRILVAQIGPDGELVFLLRRLRPDVELGDARRALAERRADAVGRGIAAADDDDMLGRRQGSAPTARRRLDVLAADAAVLLHEIGHGIMHAVEIDARNAGRSRGVSEPPQ